MQNRRQRRAMEKQSGMFGLRSLMNNQEKEEYKLRKKMLGKQIQLHNTQETENALIQAAAHREQEIIQGLIAAGHSEESAKGIVENNRRLEEKRLEKKARKRQQ